MVQTVGFVAGRREEQLRIPIRLRSLRDLRSGQAFGLARDDCGGRVVSGAEQVAEKLIVLGDELDNHPSGVKTPSQFMDLIGTDKSVPFQNSDIG